MINNKLLTNTNRKYGKKIFSFSLPIFSCKHKTSFCYEFCYARREFFNRRSVIRRYIANYLDSLKPEFADHVIEQLKGSKIKYIRIHSSGDFYSIEYFNKWIKIANKSPSKKFLAYTRNIDLDLDNIPSNMIIYQSIEGKMFLDGFSRAKKLYAIAFHAPIDIQYYQHMSRWNEIPICSSFCEFCKFCWFGKSNIAFPIRTNNFNSYKEKTGRMKYPINPR